MGNNVINEFYDYLNSNGYENRAFSIIGTLYFYFTDEDDDYEPEDVKEAFSILCNFYNSNNILRIAYTYEEKLLFIYDMVKKLVANTDESSEDAKKNTTETICKIASIDIYDPCICSYIDPLGDYLDAYIKDMLEPFFDDLDNADECIRFYLETARYL